jgi:hypothetical protein
MATRDLKDLCGLSEAERRQLDEILETRDAADSSRRKARRFTMRSREAVISLANGNSVQAIRAPVRDVSEGGLCFFYGVFVYPGTACTPKLVTVDGEQVLVPAKTVRCSHIKGRIHEIGVRFNSPIDISMFVSEAAAERDMLRTADVQWMKLQESLENLRTAFILRNLDVIRSCAQELLDLSAPAPAAGAA